MSSEVSRALMGLAMLALLVPVAGCASRNTGETYSANEVNRTAVVTHGTIVGMRDVPVQGTAGGTGTTVGAIGGGVAGSFIGGDWRSNVLAGLAGALIGGVIGNQAERAMSNGTATEFTVRENDGQTISVVQTNETGLLVGDRVRILRSDRTRLVRETGEGWSFLLATGIFPPDPGGPATWAALAVPLLSARGIETRVVTLSDRPDFNRRDRSDTVMRLRRGESRASRIPRTIATLLGAARRADIVLAAGLWAEAAIAARLAGRPLVVRIPGDPAWERAVGAGRTESLEAFQDAPLPLHWAAFRAARGAWTRAADRVLVPSEFLGRLVVGWGIRASRVTVVANAAGAVSQATSPPDHDLVWLGRMVVQKRLPALVGVARQLEATLLLAGDGPARPPASQGVTMPGLATPGILHRGRIFVQASSYEGLPHTVLEAKAHGLPVVATDVGGTAECVRHGVDGLLVPPGDDRALAEAIRTLLENPEQAAAMGAAGKQDAADRFAPGRMGDALAALLRQLAAGRQDGGRACSTDI